ncbi:Vitamin B12 transporter BtuB [Alteripontixanthobacter maritimus]|uniref:Vitamin B12 transporter BtuB n=1 Tax=Alteripontixanthobacter maritimus TaxID=2161824 RepID=A0A369Q311_9SPHN|nr:TonB-dependent receptor [Alteripontixanthobacter maritimus]RDC59283.1 Vitamin B12 transporter BtuB [Alteripontixanthobacter maritimus]
MSNRFTKASLLTGTIMAGAMIATPAFAQTSNTDDMTDQEVSMQAAPDQVIGDPIVITGSRIKQNTATAAPIAVVQDEEFQLSGTVNVENVINTLPQVIPGTTSFSNNPGGGVSTLNLRGLGTARTLVLVNGRRWVSFDTSQVVDLNTIPSFLIDSVDVVTGGASAVYGSDALAGVVNFRLREVEGAELGGQYSITERGDGGAYEIHGALGSAFADGRGNATVYGEYFNRSAVFQGDRAFSNFAVGGETFGAPLQQFGSSTLPQGRINFANFVASDVGTDLNGDGDFGDVVNGVRETPRLPIANGLIFDDAVFDNAGSPRARAGDTYNYAPVNYLQVPQERYLLGGYADYEFADGHEFFTEVSYVNNRVANELAATPVTGTFNLDIATVSQFLSPAAIAELNQIDANEAAASAERVANGLAPLPAAELGVVSTFVQRRTVETGARNSLDERNAFRVLGGVRGDITDWLNYDAYYSYARTRNANIQQGNISRSAFQAGLDGTGTPINIFGPNTLTPEQIDAISIQAQNGDVSTLQVASGALSGSVGELGFGGGPIGFAIGAEYRKVGSQFLPDTALSSGDVIGFNAGDATEGSYDVKEVFGELIVPVFDTDSGLRLELTAAGRYSDYSLDAVGGVGTYAGGIQFSPIRDITFRAQYQRAVRAPNVGELFGGRAIGFPGATDPCNNAPGAGVDAAGLARTCVASGVPAGSVGSGTIQQNAQIPALFGGNPDLQEETSDSFTAGVVLRPTFLPGFTLTADYFNIEIEDAIATFAGGLNNALDLCFNQVQDINDPICAPFRGTRSATGDIVTANPPFVGNANIASLEVAGIDLEASYTTTVPFSLFSDTGEQGLNLSFLGTWTERSNFAPIQGGDVLNECAGKFGATCGEPTPEYKWTSRASFIDGPVTTSVRWRHLSSVNDDDDGVLFTDFNGTEELDSYDLIDLTLAVDLTEQFNFNVGVTNLFDTLPDTPEFNAAGEVSNDISGSLLGDNQEQANTYPSTYDVLGRRFFVSVGFKF